MNERIAIAVLAKAPLPGFAKTRLIPALGAERAALLQARLVEHSVATACAARIGPGLFPHAIRNATVDQVRQV